MSKHLTLKKNSFNLRKAPEERAVEYFPLGEMEEGGHQGQQREIPQKILSSHNLQHKQ